MEVLKLALRNLTRNKRRNIILGIAIAFGFFVVTAIDGLASGAVSNLENQITQLVGGTVLVVGYEKTQDPEVEDKWNLVPIIRDHDYLIQKVKDLGIKYDSLSHYTRSSGQIIFNGKNVITATYGRDFEADKDFVDSLQIVSGSLENLKDPNVMIVSKGLADSLKAEVGDTILYKTSTIYGQLEVGEFTIGLITKDSNFLTGMWSYVNIETLNSLIGIPYGGYNYLSLYLRNKKLQTRVALAIEDSVRADGVPTSDLRLARRTNPTNPERGLDKQFIGDSNLWEGTKYGVETLDDGVPALKSAMNIVHTVTTIILLVILLIVMVGVSNTYRMVLYERIREIGTMRALGMTGKDTGRVFTAEAVTLCILGALAGLVLGIIVMLLLSTIHIQNESVQMFLRKGHMSISLSPAAILIQYILMVILTSMAVHGTAKKAARMTPAQALRTVK